MSRYTRIDAHNADRSYSVEQRLRPDRDGTPRGDISVAESVPLPPDLSSKARNGSPNEHLEYAIELPTLLVGSPADDAERVAVCGVTEIPNEEFEGKGTAFAFVGSGLDEEWSGRIGRTAHRVQRPHAPGTRTRS